MDAAMLIWQQISRQISKIKPACAQNGCCDAICHNQIDIWRRGTSRYADLAPDLAPDSPIAPARPNGWEMTAGATSSPTEGSADLARQHVIWRQIWHQTGGQRRSGNKR